MQLGAFSFCERVSTPWPRRECASEPILERDLYFYENSNNVRNRIGGPAAWLFLDAQ
jgi:hypothetical protein